MSERVQGTSRWQWWRVDLTGLAVMAALTALAYLFGLSPVLEARREHNARQADLAERRLQADRAAGVLAHAARELDAVQQALVNSPVRLQPHTHVNARLASLTTLAIDSDLRVDQVQPGGVTIGRRFATLPIRVAGHGRFPTVVRFIHELHERHDDTAVSSFVMRRRETPEGVQAEFECGLTWYATPTAGAAVGGVSASAQPGQR